MFDSLKIAFATYSRIPTPLADWNEHSMKYAMCFFPLVGVVLALLSGLTWLVLTRLGLHAFFIASCLTALPIVLTGGIHLDGYFDTQDALHSYAPQERKLEILKDPHIGAFAAIYGLLYILSVLACWTETATRPTAAQALPCICWGFVLSRILSGLSVVIFPKARKDGMVRAMADAADRHVVRILTAEFIAAGVLLFMSTLLGSTPLLYPLVTLLMAGLSFWWYRRQILPIFGGTTGDLCGYFLCNCERAILAGNLVCLILISAFTH